jgi:hypothetical protein
MDREVLPFAAIFHRQAVQALTVDELEQVLLQRCWLSRQSKPFRYFTLARSAPMSVCRHISNEPTAAQRLRTSAQGTSAPAGHLRVNVPAIMGRLLFAPEIRGFLDRHSAMSAYPPTENRCILRTRTWMRPGTTLCH